MDIRSRAGSLRPVRYFLNHRERDSEPNSGSRSRSEVPASTEGHNGPRRRQPASTGARAGGETSDDGSPIAIIGLGCRFPDADDPAALLDVVLTGRRAFRRLPPSRLDLADYYSVDRSTPDATYSARAALLEGWQFDLAAFGVPAAVYQAADPAHWLALETAARALAAAGFPLGQGLARARTGVVIGNTLTGDWSRAAALRLRWPYVRRVLAEALTASDIPRERAVPVLEHAAQRYLAPFPPVTDETLLGSTPAAIASRICGYFGFKGGGYAVDGSQASSLLAVTSACSALAAGELDVALAGGVDVSLDPLELVGLAKTGALARGEVRVYDENPTGFLPGEGCGMLVLMRAADAHSAGLPVYAEIAGWGASSAGQAGLAVPDAQSQLLALRRAYRHARIAPADVQLIEGHGAGTPAADSTELNALAELRADAHNTAALGSIKANIGNTKAAAGVAGLIKAVLAMSTGYIPPATGFNRPHPLLRSGDAALRLPHEPEPWPEGPRIAGVSAMGPGTDVHIVLRTDPVRGRHERKRAPKALIEFGPVTTSMRAIVSTTRSTAYLLHAPDRNALAAILARIAHIAPWLSDAELGDLACQLARDAAQQGPVRMSLVASKQEQLAKLASQGTALLSGLADGLLACRPGIYAADNADGRVTLLLSDATAGSSGAPAAVGGAGPSISADAPFRPLAALRWLDKLGVQATVAVGYGHGEIAGLVWAGCLSEADALALAASRMDILNAAADPDSASVTGTDATGSRADDRAHRLREAVRRLKVAKSRRRLISAGIGHEVGTAQDIADLLCAQLDCSPGLDRALKAGAIGATLLLETGPGEALSQAASVQCEVPAVSLGSGRGADAARAAAALFAAGALERPAALYAGRPSRPLDIWRERTFITSPCQVASPAAPPSTPAGRQAAAPLAEAAATARLAAAAELAAAERAAAAEPAEPAAPARATAPAEPAAAAAAEAPVPAAPPAAAAGQSAAPVGQSAAPAEPPAKRAAGKSTAPAKRAAPPKRAAPAEPTAAAQPGPPIQPGAPAQPTAPAEHGGSAEHGAPAERGAPGEYGTAGSSPAGRAIAERGTSPIERAIAARRRPATHRAGAAGPAAPAAPGPASARPRAASPPPASLLPARPPVATVAGIGLWARCFTEDLRPAVPAGQAGAIPTGDNRPWRVRAATKRAFGPLVRELFADDPAADRALAIAGDPANPDSCAVALAAARDAISSGQLVLITHGPGFTGFCASLHAEHPELGITVLRVPESAEGLRAAQRFAAAEPGTFRELVIDAEGQPHEVVMRPAETPGSTEFPLGPGDVVLVSRGSGGAGLALAQVLACCGARIAVIGRESPGESDEVEAGLEQLRSAEVRMAIETVNVANPTSLRRAVQRIERRLGPVTAVAHAVGVGGPQPIAELAEEDLRAQVSAETASLDRLVSAITAKRLRLIITFGSVVGRYGLAGEGLLALASGALAEQALRIADGISRCRGMHVDWPSWAGSGLGQRDSLAEGLARSGATAIPVTEGARLLLKALGTPGLPARVAVHGRVGVPEPQAIAAAAEPKAAELWGGRFVENVRVHYPGIELVCEARLTMRTDPYLADYRIDGIPVLPPPMALEAMAEVVAALAGQPMRRLSAVSMDAPVVVPPGAGDAHALIRVCALRDGAAIKAVLRCAESGFAIDHFRATFHAADTAGAAGTSLAAGLPELDELPASDTGIVDGTELYGGICFQSGQFRRAALLPEVTSRSCRALVRGGDGEPWFSHRDGATDTSLILGNPGLNDATWHVLQACVPHRRLMPATCEAVTFSGRQASGAVEIRAVEVRAGQSSARSRAGTVPAQRSAARARTPRPPVVVPVQGPGPDAITPGAQPAAYVWDVEAVDTSGRPLVTWRGLRLVDAGPIRRGEAWPASLLSVYLERSVVALGMDPELRVTVLGSQQEGTDQPEPAHAAPGAAVGVPQPSTSPDRPPAAGPDASASTCSAHGTGPLEGLVLSVRAPRAAACGWEPVTPGRASGPEPGPGLADIEDQLRSGWGEPTTIFEARMRAMAACLAMAGIPAASPVVVDSAGADGLASGMADSASGVMTDSAADDGWLLLRVAGATLACTVVEISGVSCPVAIAVMTGNAAQRGGRHTEGGQRARRAGGARASAAKKTTARGRGPV
jgi:enediyne polyketide synthase